MREAKTHIVFGGTGGMRPDADARIYFLAYPTTSDIERDMS